MLIQGGIVKLLSSTASLLTLLLPPSLAAAQEVGIPVCDDFIAKYESCVTGKIPAASQAEFANALTQWRTEWKKLAADPNNNMILTGICNQMQAQSKASLSPFGCAF
jgi:hypothetical protein